MLCLTSRDSEVFGLITDNTLGFMKVKKHTGLTFQGDHIKVIRLKCDTIEEAMSIYTLPLLRYIKALDIKFPILTKSRNGWHINQYLLPEPMQSCIRSNQRSIEINTWWCSNFKTGTIQDVSGNRQFQRSCDHSD